MATTTIFLAGLNGNTGFRMDGRAGGLGFKSGISVASAGDVNGDGFDDIIIGDPSATDEYGTAGWGESYIVYGKAAGFASSLNLGSLNGANGVVIRGSERFDDSGYSVAGAGDINGDGFDDVIIGAPQATQDDDDIFVNYPYTGEANVVLGGASLPGLMQLSPTQVLAGNFYDIDDNTGFCVASAGDVNGDGFDDMILSAPSGRYDSSGPGGANKTGDSYVVFGKASFVPFSLESLNGANGFKLHGANDGSGRSVAGAGDVNGDGYDDIVVGAYTTGPSGFFSSEGTSYVVFGKAAGFAATLDLTVPSTLDGSKGLRIVGNDTGDWAGWSVASAGDVNGDGYDDLLVGARNAEGTELSGDREEGETYVVFGGTAAYLNTLHGAAGFNLGSVNGLNGLRIRGADGFDNSGWSVSSAGDVNGDGYDDILIGAPKAADEAGVSYVVFGGSKTYLDGLHGANGFDLKTINGTNGFRMLGVNNDTGSFPEFGDYSGTSVASAGDVNSDGFDDILIGAWGANPAGESYLVFGRDFRSEADYLGTAGADVKTGGAAVDIMIGRMGNDNLSGAGGADRLSGNDGNDILNGGVGGDFMCGGDGNDTYVVGDATDLVREETGEGTDLVKSSISHVLSARVENLLLTGTAANGSGNAGANTVTGNNAKNLLDGKAGNDNLKGMGNNDTLVGGTGDDTLDGGAGADRLVGGAGNDTLVWGEGDTFLGDAGVDILRIAAGNVDLTTVTNDKLQAIEKIDLLIGAHTLTLASSDVIDMSPTNQVTILGDGADTVNISGAQVAGGAAPAGFTRYTISGAVLIIDSDITVV